MMLGILKSFGSLSIYFATRNERISLNAKLINAGRFRIAKHMKEWIRAYTDAVWSPAAYERGEWARLDDGSYPVDCLDSAEYGLYPFKRYLQ